MSGDDVFAREILKHGGYVCLTLANGIDRRTAGAVPVEALAQRLGLRNEFAPGDGPPRDSIAFLRRHDATPSAIADDDLLQADAVVHVASPAREPVAEFCTAATRLLGDLGTVRVLGGVVRPRNYTGAAMQNFAYAHAVVQQPGTAMPNGFLIPMSKTAAWWSKGWMPGARDSGAGSCSRPRTRRDGGGASRPCSTRSASRRPGSTSATAITCSAPSRACPPGRRASS